MKRVNENRMTRKGIIWKDDEWDNKHLHRLDYETYEELLDDIEVLKDEYNWDFTSRGNGFPFWREVDLSKQKPKRRMVRESVGNMKSLKKRLNEARHANVGTIELKSRSWLFGHTSKGFFGWVYYGWILQDGEEIGFYELNDQDYNRPYITLYVSEETKKQWKDTKKRRADVPKKEIIDFVLNSRPLKRYKQGNHGIEDVYIKTYKDYIRKVDSGKYPKGISTSGQQWAEFCNTFQRFTGERFAHPYGYYMDLEEPREVRIAAQKYADLMHLV
jgi:hypothetical protein